MVSAEVHHDRLEAADKRALVVLGMHRSGTSAMARSLALLGAKLPTGLMPPVENNNESGFWESQDVADLNDEILQELDSEWDDVFSFKPREYLSNFDRFFLGRAVEVVNKAFAGSELIVLKDPRISVLAAFWNRALLECGYAPTYVIMVRNPLEVAESLRSRDGFPREKSWLLWSSYMIALDRDTRDHRRLFVAYDQLMDNWRAVRDRIETCAGFPFPRNTSAAANEIDRFLKRRLRHHDERGPESLFARSDIPEGVKALYRIFRSACDGQQIDRASLEEVESEFQGMERYLGPLLADDRARIRSLVKERQTLEQSAHEASARAMESEERASTAQQQRDEALHKQQDLERRLQSTVNQLVATEETKRDLAQRAEGLELTAKELERKSEELEASRALIERSLSEVSRDLRAATERVEVLDQELERAQAERSQVDERLDGRFRELASLTELLVAQEERARQAEQEFGWMKEAAAILADDLAARKGILKRLLPAFLLLRRQRKRLQRSGVFDADSYLAANPDVAKSAGDPLQHYLRHGIDENRPLG